MMSTKIIESSYIQAIFVILKKVFIRHLHHNTMKRNDDKVRIGL